jgi:nucleoside-triphosphatase THEP1
MQAILEFEKPIEELEVKIAELRNFATEKGIDLTNEIAILENRAREVKESIYSNLNSWQKVLIARHPERPNVYDYIKHLLTPAIYGVKLLTPGKNRPKTIKAGAERSSQDCVCLIRSGVILRYLPHHRKKG